MGYFLKLDKASESHTTHYTTFLVWILMSKISEVPLVAKHDKLYLSISCANDEYNTTLCIFILHLFCLYSPFCSSLYLLMTRWVESSPLSSSCISCTVGIFLLGHKLIFWLFHVLHNCIFDGLLLFDPYFSP